MSVPPADPVIRDLAADDGPELARAIAAMRLSDPDFVFALGWDAADDVERYRQRLDAHRHGRDLPPGWVASTLRFAFVAGRLVGRVSVRHRLTPALERSGGHIGYGVIAGFRRRGIATALLRDGLAVARGVGIEQALITCDDANAGSIAVIERCGGVLDATVADGDGQTMRRYWART